MALVGHRYIQDTQPGTPPSGGYEWFDTSSGLLWIRNMANTSWVQVGDSGINYMGNVPVVGATMTGALVGVTGFAPNATPDFQGSAKRDGIELATKGDISSLRRELMAKFNQMSAEAMSALSGSSGSGHNIAIKTGFVEPTTVAFSFQIPKPQYDGGTGDEAKRAEILIHGIWPVELDIHDNAVSGNNISIKATLTNDTTMIWSLTNGRDGGTTHYFSKWKYLVIAVR